VTMRPSRRRKDRAWTFRPVPVMVAHDCPQCGRSWAVFAQAGDEPELRGCPGCGCALPDEEYRP